MRGALNATTLQFWKKLEQEPAQKRARSDNMRRVRICNVQLS